MVVNYKHESNGNVSKLQGLTLSTASLVLFVFTIKNWPFCEPEFIVPDDVDDVWV